MLKDFIVENKRKHDMGSLSWGLRPGKHSLGRLSRLEKLKLIGGVAYTLAQDGADSVLSALGILHPVDKGLEALAPPETGLTRDSLAFASETQDAALLEHSWRSYYLAVLFGEYRGLDVDREVLFAASILHDTGLATDRTSRLTDCCFAVSGALRVEQELKKCGHATDKVNEIGDAISMHLNGYVSAGKHGAVPHLVSRGAYCDVFGFGKRRIAERIWHVIAKRHPRVGLEEVLEAESVRHLVGSRAHFLTTFSESMAKSKFAMDGLRRGALSGSQAASK